MTEEKERWEIEFDENPLTAKMSKRTINWLKEFIATKLEEKCCSSYGEECEHNHL